MRSRKPVTSDTYALATASLVLIGVVTLISILIARDFTLGPSLVTTKPTIPSAMTHPMNTRVIHLDGQAIEASIAETDATREKGLGGRNGLASDEGMLFVFPHDGAYAFWMKDMLFSIDILWLSADGTIVYMAQNVSPDTYPQDFVPATPARYVLELPAGYAKGYTVSIGDKVQL